MIWVTSDWHLGHKNITEYCGRPADWFEKIWEGLSCVQPLDTLIHLGDFAFRQGPGALQEFWARMPSCRRILVMGNHDKRSRCQKLPWDAVVPPVLQPLMAGADGVPFLLAHKWELRPEGFEGVFVHGHTHEKGQLYTWRGPTFMVNVCVEQTRYLPMTLTEIVAEYRLKKSEKSA